MHQYLPSKLCGDLYSVIISFHFPLLKPLGGYLSIPPDAGLIRLCMKEKRNLRVRMLEDVAAIISLK